MKSARHSLPNIRPTAPALPGNESGLALLMTVFIIALSAVIVFELANTVRVDQRAFRGFSEGVQSDFVLKSALTLGQVIIESRKLFGRSEDWPFQPWARVASLPSLPIDGLTSETRMVITDESGKIDLNSIDSTTVPPPAQSIFWMQTLAKLFRDRGFVEEKYDPDLFRTIGDVGYAAEDQVAVLHDWIDADDVDFHDPSAGGFTGEGKESHADRALYPGRKLKNLSELLLVPGMTAERVSQIASFVRVSPSRSPVNINTASYEVLSALNFPADDIGKIMQDQQKDTPIDSAKLRSYNLPNQQMVQYLTFSSNEFSIIARTVSASSTRWLRAYVKVSGGGGGQATSGGGGGPRSTSEIESLELY